MFRVDRAHHHDLPAGLAIADQTRFALGIRMARDHRFDKTRFRLAHILNRLTGDRVRQKADEIARIASAEGDPDLAIGLHASDPRAMASAWVKNNEWPPVLVDRGAFGRDDPREPVIHRPGQRAAIEHQLDFKAQDMRCLAGIVLAAVIAALPQYVEQQNGPLPRINPVLEQVVRAGQRPW